MKVTIIIRRFAEMSLFMILQFRTDVSTLKLLFRKTNAKDIQSAMVTAC